jgi:hypothetical protein
MVMIFNSAVKQEMLSLGYTVKGEGQCPRCHETVEYLEHPAGTRKTAINKNDHPTRPGMLHSLGCGVRQE